MADNLRTPGEIQRKRRQEQTGPEPESERAWVAKKAPEERQGGQKEKEREGERRHLCSGRREKEGGGTYALTPLSFGCTAQMSSAEEVFLCK